MRPPLRGDGPRAAGAAGRARGVRGALARAPCSGPAAVHRSQAVYGAHRRRREVHGPGRGHRVRRAGGPPRAGRGRDHGLLVHGRQHGRRGGREAGARLRPCRPEGPAAHRGRGLGWCAHAGGHVGADADGQDGHRPGCACRGPRAGGGGAGAPHHGRRVGLVRVAGRHHLCGARRAHRLQRPPRDRGDHPRGASFRLRARGAAAGERPGGRRGGPARAG